MRPVKDLVLIAALIVFCGVFLLQGSGGADSDAPTQCGKPATWGGDSLVHAGKVTTYARNGFSSDYDVGTGNIYVAVVGYSSSYPDTCYLYKSTDNGASWLADVYWVDTGDKDISNAQVLVGEGGNKYLFLAGRVDQDNGDIVVYRRLLPSGGWSPHIIGGTEKGIKNFVLTREQGANYYLHLAYSSDVGDVFYLRSTNYGENWTNYETLDGDMPHIAVAGADGSEDIYLTWRLDGENGALYSTDDHGKVKKNKQFLANKWYLTPNMATSDTAFCIYQHELTGMIYVGTGNSGDVYRSQDGGDSWTLMSDLSGAEHVHDIVGDPLGVMVLAATGEPARIFKWWAGSWQEVHEISGEDAFLSLAFDPSTHHFYAGTAYDNGDVYKSTNGGHNWFEVGDELTGLDEVHCLIVTDSGTVLAAGQGLGSYPIYRSTNGGTSWQQVGPDLGYYRALLQASDGSIYATGYHWDGAEHEDVLKSTDDGVNWSSLPDAPTVAFFMCEDPFSNLYIGHPSTSTYRSTNGGASWEVFSGSTEATDMIASQSKIAVKKSTTGGTSWGDAEILSRGGDDVSDPKVAAGQGTASYKVWVVYSQREYTGDWNLRCGFSENQGTSWNKDNTIEAGDWQRQLPVLKGKRGSSGPIHLAFVSDKDGTDRVYWADVMPGAPTSWGAPISIGTWKASNLHCPELTFVSSPAGPGVFYCRLFGFPYASTRDLFFDAQHFTAVEDEEDDRSLLSGFSLFQNYPNPFNPTTRIQYTVDSRQTPAPNTQGKAVDGSQSMVHGPLHTTLKIYNIQGQLVRTLVDEVKEEGKYQAIWDGKTDRGKDVACGIYLYELKMGDYSQTKKMILIK
jgi:photosystem II stability/assembly factor-like uncharacterized protein